MESTQTGYSSASRYASADPAARRAQIQAGVTALRDGRASEARAIFEGLMKSGPVDAALMTALALACRADGQPAMAMSLADRVLAADPEQIRTLILKGDLLAEGGDARAAVAFYGRVLSLAGDAAGAPEEIRVELRRIAAFCDARSQALEQNITAALQQAGLEGERAGARFAESVDLLFGRRQTYYQAPRYFFYPGLVHRSFFENSAFPFLAGLEAHTDVIREEARAVMADRNSFEPYVKADRSRPASDQAGLADNPAWGAYYLWKDGKPVDDHLARCPATAKALEALPLCVMPNRSPSVLFSRLLPGAHIPPHNGLVNTRLIGHLPLIVPPGCRFRVGNETREWQEGKAWLFDDSIEHEAWNDSGRERVILLFEVWRPELSETEQRAIQTLFQALDTEQGGPPKWEI